MQIHFLGAARTVTGSMHLVEANDQRILLDCGLYQGRREEAAEKNRNLGLKGEDVTSVILSHGHIDHSGNLPTMVKSGFKGPIHATSATKDLCNLMLRDSARIQLRDVEYLKKKKRQFTEPLYTPQHARATIKQFQAQDYDTWFDVGPGIRARFQDAGHIIGSASVHLEIKEPGKERIRLTFTGDLGRPGLPILRDPAPLPEAEVILTESTYGGRCHSTQGDVSEHMKSTLKTALMTAVKGKGKLVIPAFSVGRTQNILYFLNELMAEGQVPITRIFIDSPLATKATDLIRRHPECFDTETLEKMNDRLKPLLADHVYLARSTRESKLINQIKGTCVIISASGMCEFGRILHHLRQNLDDPNSVVAFVGYQAHETLGRRIVEGAKSVQIYGRTTKVRANVLKLNGFSAHADRDELLTALNPLQKSAGHTFIVHGDTDQSMALGRTLDDRGFGKVIVPKEGEVIAVN